MHSLEVVKVLAAAGANIDCRRSVCIKKIVFLNKGTHSHIIGQCQPAVHQCGKGPHRDCSLLDWKGCRHGMPLQGTLLLFFAIFRILKLNCIFLIWFLPIRELTHSLALGGVSSNVYSSAERPIWDYQVVCGEGCRHRHSHYRLLLLFFWYYLKIITRKLLLWIVLLVQDIVTYSFPFTIFT